MRSLQIAAIDTFLFCAFFFAGPGAAFSNETFYDTITLDRLIDLSDYIAIVEKSGIPATSEKISIGLGYPPFIKTIHHFTIREVLYMNPRLKMDRASTIDVVMAHYLSELDIHTRYHKDKLSKSPVYERYKMQSCDGLKEKRFIIFAKQHYITAGYFEKKIVPVRGMLEWTAENSYETAANREAVIKLLKSKMKETVDAAVTGKYSIDDIPVTAEKFNAFLKTLKEMPGTWFCAETNTGGATGYDAVDLHGAVYQYRAISDAGNSRCTITRKK